MTTPNMLNYRNLGSKWPKY